ncbi:MAG: helix-turn-helix domain-containing protein [Nanoarchaeota archaeon]|nr:helix-turn-helix domain-containing protein [Nanoarchaeota archaeon]
MELGSLKELGLTDNEIKIYIFLLKNGESTTGPIIDETLIANSRVYESLNTLIKKGFVSYNVQSNGKHFSCIEPDVLIEKQEEKRKKFLEIIPQLESIKKIKNPETKTAIYEGFEGFKSAFRKIINDCPNKGIIYIIGFSEQQFKSESLRIFISNMNLKSAEKKQKLKIILDSSVKETLGKDREKERFTEVRYMPKGYINPTAVDITEDYVYIFLWEEKPYVFMIKNKRISESFKQYFDFLWKISRK